MTKQNILSFLVVSAFIFLISLFASGFITKKNTAFSLTSESDVPPSYYSVKVPDNAVFAGESVPVYIDDVKERFERELLVTAYRHSTTFLMLKRKSRWFPVIEQILAEEGVPDDFKYLCVAESALANAVSPAGARGFWQFLEGTAKQYGLEVNSEVDERYHVEKSTRAACKYLKDAKRYFGSWTEAAASYNMGMAGLRRQMDNQNQQDYFDLLLNQETSRYIFRIMAYKEVLSNPEKYGFIVNHSDTYNPYQYREVFVDSSVSDFAAFAAKYGTNYKTLKLLNPWLRDKTLTVKYNTYYIKVPN